MVVAFATQSDQIAADGAGRNSPFTDVERPNVEVGYRLSEVIEFPQRVTRVVFIAGTLCPVILRNSP